MNYYLLLDLLPVFAVDPAELEAAYFREQRKFHPDRFVGKTQMEKNAALSRSMDINQAYDILKNPLKRAQYLLKLEGIAVGTEADSVKPTQALLVEIMELREEPPAKDMLEKLYNDSINYIADFFAQKDWQAMAQETLRLGYLTKILADIK